MSEATYHVEKSCPACGRRIGRNFKRGLPAVSKMQITCDCGLDVRFTLDDVKVVGPGQATYRAVVECLGCGKEIDCQHTCQPRGESSGFIRLRETCDRCGRPAWLNLQLVEADKEPMKGKTPEVEHDLADVRAERDQLRIDNRSLRDEMEKDREKLAEVRNKHRVLFVRMGQIRDRLDVPAESDNLAVLEALDEILEDVETYKKGLEEQTGQMHALEIAMDATLADAIADREECERLEEECRRLQVENRSLRESLADVHDPKSQRDRMAETFGISVVREGEDWILEYQDGSTARLTRVDGEPIFEGETKDSEEDEKDEEWVPVEVAKTRHDMTPAFAFWTQSDPAIKLASGAIALVILLYAVAAIVLRVMM